MSREHDVAPIGRPEKPSDGIQLTMEGAQVVMVTGEDDFGLYYDLLHEHRVLPNKSRPFSTDPGSRYFDAVRIRFASEEDAAFYFEKIGDLLDTLVAMRMIIHDSDAMQ